METDALLSVEEAARKLGGISKWTVHQWLSQGKLCRTKVGGRTMIRESELAKVIQEGGNDERDATADRKTRTFAHTGAGRAGNQIPPPGSNGARRISSLLSVVPNLSGWALRALGLCPSIRHSRRLVDQPASTSDVFSQLGVGRAATRQ